MIKPRRQHWEALGNLLLANLRARHTSLRGDLNTIDLRQAIVDEATAQGVPPAIALAVAMQESGIQQWTADGELVTGTSGEIGMFQLMPATAAQLGVNPEDPLQNIRGGIKYLAANYGKFGSWPLALVAYNWGPGNLQKYLSTGQNPSTFQRVMQNYAMPILAGAGMGAAAGVSSAATPQPAQMPADSNFALPAVNQTSNLPVIVVAIAAGIFGVKWLLGD